MTYICILGRQPALGLAELESYFGATSVAPLRDDMAQLEISEQPNFDNFGGIQKVVELIETLPYTDWNKIARHLQQILPKLLQTEPEGKVTLGISAHSLRTNPAQINATALSLKKVIKKEGRPARIVPNKDTELNTAQVLHNKLTQQNGIEFTLIAHNNTTLLARTVWVQDIEAYARRDQGRPARDARVGMLPPKLAQIIINLASTPQSGIVYDPFCGTGVLLQEALLMNKAIKGSDLEPRMIEYTAKNLTWLKEKYPDIPYNPTATIKVADATEVKLPTWEHPEPVIACETYLGRPFSHEPDAETLSKVRSDVNLIHKKFLQNVARQTQAGFRMCIAVPAWHTKSGVKHLPTLDHLEELGYNRIEFVHADSRDLIYHRPGQVVGRELVTLVRI